MPTDTPTIVLIGHGMVGQRFLEALAERGLTATHRVVVLCEEPRPAYDRVQLTSYFSGKTPEDLSMTDTAFIETHGIELYVGDPALSVDREAKKVTAKSGRIVGYDILVLATGSYPFVPPVPHKDARGCFVYRTIEDLLAIEEYARTSTTGAVVGGGLLGLEAAGALKGLGLTTHIVEFAPRLMPVQVDEGGGAALLRTIEDMGLAVHTGVGTQEIVAGADGAVTGMKLSDGSELATDMVVFSAGVRPRDQLARDCGLDVGERGGIAVDELVRGFFDRYYPDEPVPVALDEPIAGAAERARPLVGHYRSAQRPYTTIEVLTHDAPVAPLTAAADGTLRFLGRRWVEIEPSLYRSTSSDDLLAFLTDERGRVTGAALGSSALDRVRWYERSGAHLGLIAVCLAVLLSAILGWAGTALSRRPRRVERWPRLARAARWVAWGAAVLVIVDLAALVATLSRAPLIYGVPPILRVLTTIPYGIAALTLGVLAFAAVAWRRKLWTASGRVHYTLVGLALVGVLFVMAVYNVLGPHLG